MTDEKHASPAPAPAAPRASEARGFDMTPLVAPPVEVLDGAEAADDEPQLGDRLADEPWATTFDLALTRCRSGEWELGLELLTRVYYGVRKQDLPGLFFSYLGYGGARCEGEVKHGLKLCRRAVQMEFYQPDNYLNLARTLLLTNDRQAAVEAVQNGLTIDEEHFELLTLRDELGERRAPAVGFLSRGSILNRLLGRVRHDLLSGPRVRVTRITDPDGTGSFSPG